MGKSKQWYTLSKIYFNDWKNQKYLAIQTKFCRSSGQRSLKHIKPGLSQEPELVGSLCASFSTAAINKNSLEQWRYCIPRLYRSSLGAFAYRHFMEFSTDVGRCHSGDIRNECHNITGIADCFSVTLEAPNVAI